MFLILLNLNIPNFHFKVKFNQLNFNFCNFIITILQQIKLLQMAHPKTIE